MKRKASKSAPSGEAERPLPYRVRLPGFITGEEFGLGDVIERTTTYIGIRPCQGCGRRAATLNRWLVFSPRRER